MLALECGATTIGNISQYFNLAYPEWKDDVAIAIETVKAIGTLAALKSQGTLVHSNLDDGFGSQFRDLTSLVGWTLFEKYLVEELMGAKITFCYGHVHSSPIRRIAFLQALNTAYGDDFIGFLFVLGIVNF